MAATEGGLHGGLRRSAVVGADYGPSPAAMKPNARASPGPAAALQSPAWGDAPADLQ